MYRILSASSGWYYVEEHSSWNGWTKVGGFFFCKASARRYIRRLQNGPCNCGPTPKKGRVVEYVN